MSDNKEIGYVYILTNPSFREDWVKIGKSARPVDVRSKELDNTAVPLPFEIYATIRTIKYNEVEKLVHELIDSLTDFRIRRNREFFNVNPQRALEIFKKIALTIDDAVITEYTDNKLIPNNSGSVAYQDSAHNKGKDYTKYSLNGNGVFGKGKLALEIIRCYVQENQVCYQDLFAILPKKLIKTVKEVDDWKRLTEDKKKDTRWFEHDVLESCDGVKFLVSTQHGKNNIDKIFELANKFGYEIKELK